MLLNLLKKVIPGYEIAKEIYTAGQWAAKGLDILKKKDVEPSTELTRPQTELIESVDISTDLRKLLINVLPKSIVDNINDKSKVTKNTLVIVKQSIKELDAMLDSLIAVSDKIDESIPD